MTMKRIFIIYALTVFLGMITSPAADAEAVFSESEGYVTGKVSSINVETPSGYVP